MDNTKNHSDLERLKYDCIPLNGRYRIDCDKDLPKMVVYTLHWGYGRYGIHGVMMKWIEKRF